MILTFVEHERGTPDPLSLQALTLARRLAEALDTPLHAILIGDDTAASPAIALKAFGPATVHLARAGRLAAFAPAAWAQVILDVANSAGAEAIVAAGTNRGSEVLAHAAAKASLPMAANCVAVEPGETYLVTRMRWGGSLLEEARLEGSPKLLTVAPQAVPAEEAASPGKAEVESIAPTISDGDLRVRVNERIAAEDQGVSLADAQVVVGGGRGVGSAEGFARLEELARALGGAVGVSRAVTSLGWRPHAEQIGQTGTPIAPKLYIACGISGATQHMVGCKGAKHIVAVNTDPEAPILAKADAAVIGDLHAVVPAVVAELARRGNA